MTSSQQTRLCRSNGIKTLLQTKIMKAADMICLADFHGLRP